MLLRFVDGRPVSAVTIDFLKVCCLSLAARVNHDSRLIWDMPRGTKVRSSVLAPPA